MQPFCNGSNAIFICDLTTNCGPANANREMSKYFKNIKTWNTKNHTFKNIISGFLLFIKSNVVISSSNYRVNYILFAFAHLLRKKTIYIMHGYNKLEHRINKTKDYSGRETKTLKRSSLILPVSEKYMQLFLDDRPEFVNKTYYLTNGITKKRGQNKNEKKIQKLIVVSGGNRNIKRNRAVCEAVSLLNRRGHDFKLEVYGDYYPNNEELIDNEFIEVHNQVSRKKFLSRLSKTNIFIMNSDYESFGLSAIDALQQKCNVLISKNCGVCSILELKEDDIINDNSNSRELADKILNIFANNNAERLLKTINFEKCSWKNTAHNLENIVELIDKNKNIKAEYGFLEIEKQIQAKRRK